MAPGKLAAQASHACAQSLLQYLKSDPDALGEFITAGVSGTRVVLFAPRAWDLQQIVDAAQAQGIPAALFEDSGHVLPPHFDGSPIITAAAIGPAPRELLRPLVKQFNCV